MFNTMMGQPRGVATGAAIPVRWGRFLDRPLHQLVVVRYGWALISPEAAFAWMLMPFVYSGYPVRPFLLAYVLGFALFDLVRGRFRLPHAAMPALVCWGLIVAYAHLSYTWTPGPQLGGQILANLWSRGLPILLCAIYAFRDRGAARRFMIGGMVAGPVLLVRVATLVMAVLQSGDLSQLEDAGDIKDFYQGININLALSATCALGLAIYGHTPLILRALALGVLGAVMYGMMLAGGTSGVLMIGLATTVMLAFLFAPVRGRLLMFDGRHLLLVLGFVAVVGWLFTTGTGDEFSTLRRLTNKVGGGAEMEVYGGRPHLWQLAWEVWTMFPLFGGGIGGFSHYADLGGSAGMYPHNVLIEFFTDYGVFGGGLGLLLVALALYAGRAARPDLRYVEDVFPFMIAAAALGETLVVGNLGDPYLCLALGALLLCPRPHRSIPPVSDAAGGLKGIR